jgi:transposase
MMIAVEHFITGAPSMEEITTVGIDLAKSIFHVHAVSQAGHIVLQKAFKRRSIIALFEKLPPCLVGMEACSSAHHWGRVLSELGHEVRLIPPAYVKPYVRRQKNDAADAAAICEAVTRPTMRFVPIKTEEQQAALMLHRARALLMSQRTALICAIRGHMAELGLTAPRAVRNMQPLLDVLGEDDDESLPPLARVALRPLADQLAQIDIQLARLDRELLTWHRTNPISQRLASIPGVGPVTATALAASVSEPTMFSSAREFSAYLGLVPRQNSSGGRTKLGRISKMGDRYLRSLLVSGAASLLSPKRKRSSVLDVWAKTLIEKNKPTKLVAIALANKMARIAWALMTRGESFRDPVPAV